VGCVNTNTRQEAARAPRERQSTSAFHRSAGAILWKDLVAELRSKELVSAMLVFALIVVVVFNFAVELRLDLARQTAIGFLWITILFAGMLGLNRSLAREKDRGCLDGLLLAPMARGMIFVGKMIGNLIFILAIEIVVVPLFIFLFNVPFQRPLLLLAVLLGTIGFAGVGTLLSAMAVHTRARDVMLPIILLPVTIPLVLAAVRASRMVVDGRAMSEYWPWAGILVAFDLVLIVVSYLTFDYIVEE
jgi:heme exporter protein B